MKALHLQSLPSASLQALLISAVVTMSAHAQQSLTPSLTAQQLAISVHNPFEDFVKVPIQSPADMESIVACARLLHEFLDPSNNR